MWGRASVCGEQRERRPGGKRKDALCKEPQENQGRDLNWGSLFSGSEAPDFSREPLVDGLGEVTGRPGQGSGI